jgi:hypothetical protein
MRQLAEDARYIRAGSPSNLYVSATCTLFSNRDRPQYNYHRPEEIITSYPTFPYYTPRIVYKWLQQKWSPPALKPPNTDPRLAAIAEMLIQLKTSITAFQIAHNYVLLSWPDFEADTGHIYPNLFYLACELAGLQCLPRSAPAFRFAIEDARIDFWEMCTTESSDPLCRGPRTALALNYNAASLGITLLDTKEMGVLWPVIAEENVELGAGSALHLDDAPQYWARIKAAIQESLQHERIPLEHLMLLGNHVDNGEFLEVVEQVLEERGYTDVWPNLMITDPVFAAARGAAHIAWIQMEREFGCDAPRTRPSSETEKQRDEL